MQNRFGFTLTELIVTVTILGILGAVAFISYNSYARNARDAVRSQDVANITNVINLFQQYKGIVPSTTDPVNITYSGATLWTQGIFGEDTKRILGKIFGPLLDPLYEVPYTYSVTENQKEYQLGVVYENRHEIAIPFFSFESPELFGQAYANTTFLPSELNPIIWLDAKDINGDGNEGNNPSNSSVISTWQNKGTLGASANPTISGNIYYAAQGFDGDNGTGAGEPAVFIPNNAGVLFSNSAITNGDIFYVVENRDPFGSTDGSGRALQGSTSSSYIFGYNSNYADVIRISSAPNFTTTYPANTGSRLYPKIYGFHKNGSNYEFRDTGRILSQGATNSITGIDWCINQSCSSISSADWVISEILIFDTPLSLEDREKVEGYLAHKWGEDPYLPTSHTYKSDPPPSGNTVTPDTTPDSFSFGNVTGADVSTVVTSSSATITGINTSTPISISGGGSYSINGGTFTSTAGSIVNGDSIRVRLTSSSSFSTTVGSTVTIGSVASTFSVTTLAADTTPDSFTLSDVSNANLGALYTSNSVTISGLNTSVPISISGPSAQYRVSTGVEEDVSGITGVSSSHNNSGSPATSAFDNNSSTGWGNTGVVPTWFAQDLGSGNERIVSKYTLYRSSSQPGGWWSSDSPRDWVFQGSQNGTSWTTLDTQTGQYIYTNATKQEFSFANTVAYRYYRIYITATNSSDGSNWANISEMELIDEGNGSFTSATGTVGNGDIVTVRIPAPSSAGSSSTANLTVGSFSESFIVSTTAPDTTPDTFSFPAVNNANLNTSYTSNSVTITGINAPAPISISGGSGTYSINGGAFTASAGTISNNATVRVRLTSSSSNSQTRSTTLTIGGVSAVFNVTTPAPPPDTTPDPFSFIDETNAIPNTQYISNTIIISGINSPASLTISGGEYEKNGTHVYTSASTTVNNGDSISLRNTSSTSVGTTVNTTLTIGGVTDTYSITTIPPDTTPDTFSFDDVTDASPNTESISNAVAVSGVNTATPISISGGGMYNVNGGTYTSSAGTIYNGDIIRVRLTSSANELTPVNGTLTIGGVSDTYSVTTFAFDTSPDDFVLSDITSGNLATAYTSNSILVSGINVAVPISITGGSGTYRINGGSFTSASSTVNNGDIVEVQLTSSSQKNKTVSTLLQIGDQDDQYDVTTKDVNIKTERESGKLRSNVVLTGNYNGLIVHGKNDTEHYILASPSIVASDISNPNFLDIISEKKLVYDSYENIPASYPRNISGLSSTGGLDFNPVASVLFTGLKKDIGSYGGLKAIDDAIRLAYNNFPEYRNIARYLDDYSLLYLEKIIGEVIGINPIKPYYCSDIARSKLVYNIAKEATVTATPGSYNSYGIDGITNGIISTEGDLDYEYHSAETNAFIEFEWEDPKAVGYIKIFNRTGCCKARLSGAQIQLFNSLDQNIYTHTLWDTSQDNVIDLDLEGIGHLYDVKKLRIVNNGNYINIREVEIYLGGALKDGVYKVDKDGAGGLDPYNVFCDMTTDGGGWTRIGENFISNGEFKDLAHPEQYQFTDPLYNTIITSETPPIYISDANVLRHSGDTNKKYQLYFPEIPGEYFAQEIRLSAWVKGTSASIFHNTLEYDTTATSTTQPDPVVLESDGSWKYQMVRIPVSGAVKDFTWDLGREVNGTFYVTGLKLEVYYK